MEDTVRAMTFLINQGMAYYWGTSEWSADQITEAYSVARQFHLIPPVLEQSQFNMFTRDKVERDFHKLYNRDVGLGVVGFGPLMNGILSGKYNGCFEPPTGSRLSKDEFKEASLFFYQNPYGQDMLHKVALLSAIATELNVSMSQLALGWALLNPKVSSLLLGGNVEQLQENLGGITAFQILSNRPEVITRIEAILNNKPIIASHFGR
eukprot:TRINITY_DN6192_c0_g1_i1.p1 TRINITY_DN6192_c0_g1~~TRINITY_DN6192_c0_g1_i1.p1  ORF type:complete len:208 (+),score=19.47 TRINITY_DN6192_c0_g1_i1:68-691(+)